MTTNQRRTGAGPVGSIMMCSPRVVWVYSGYSPTTAQIIKIAPRILNILFRPLKQRLFPRQTFWRDGSVLFYHVTQLVVSRPEPGTSSPKLKAAIMTLINSVYGVLWGKLLHRSCIFSNIQLFLSFIYLNNIWLQEILMSHRGVSAHQPEEKQERL